ncbi:MAG: hypothetical protein AB7E52_08935 [Bdellovibrionales bacterium]
MDRYQIFAFGAIFITAARYLTYFYTIYKGKTKPHAFSWLLWGVETGIATLAQLELEAGPSVWALAFVSISCLIIAVLSLFIGEREYAKSDWFALIACLLAFPVWKLVQSPLAALVIIMITDMLTYWPTVRKSFTKPCSEPPVSYGFAGMRYFLMLFAVPNPSFDTLIYPLFLMFMDWGFAVYIVIRRAQLGYPLHEYAKREAVF